jgi:putative oxidoreductase
MADQSQVRLALLFTRISIALVLFMWTLDKFVNPQHAIDVYAYFYFIGGLSATAIYTIGGLEMALIVCFIAGIKKNISYLIVLIIHAVSTLSSFAIYLSPFGECHLLFFAAWPMLAACVLLYLMRGSDTMLSFNLR